MQPSSINVSLSSRFESGVDDMTRGGLQQWKKVAVTGIRNDLGLTTYATAISHDRSICIHVHVLVRLARYAWRVLVFDKSLPRSATTMTANGEMRWVALVAK